MFSLPASHSAEVNQQMVTSTLQDKVINNITELYTFMDTSDATLGLKVLGEGGDEEENAGHDEHHAEHAGEALSATNGIQYCPQFIVTDNQLPLKELSKRLAPAGCASWCAK